jgi:uronate dehydrogenase
MRVLVTGAAGRIGTVVSSGLAGEHEVRGIDLRAPDSPFPGEFSTGDCSRPETAARAVRGVDAVVHLAGEPGESDLRSELSSHTYTTAVLLDAMVEHSVGRMVYASSNHAVGMTPRSTRLGVEVAPRPDTFYGVAKVAAEALLVMYADRHRLSSVAMRIGSFRERPQTRRELSTWLSHDDCVRMVKAAVIAEFTGVRVVYGISSNADGWWDLEPGRMIGYHPVDDAAAFALSIPRREDDEAELARVGGGFALPAYARRPFPANEHEEG